MSPSFVDSSPGDPNLPGVVYTLSKQLWRVNTIFVPPPIGESLSSQKDLDFPSPFYQGLSAFSPVGKTVILEEMSTIRTGRDPQVLASPLLSACLKDPDLYNDSCARDTSQRLSFPEVTTLLIFIFPFQRSHLNPKK